MSEIAYSRWQSTASVQDELTRQPHLFLRLAENALTVAESLRGNYFHNTAKFVSDLRVAQRRAEPLFRVGDVTEASWADVRDEVVTFIDGGVGQVRISGKVPVLLRVGSYSIRTGERRLAEREQFGYYPIVLGDLEGGSKDRPDFVDVVRITAELLGGLSALERNPDLRVLMFHGPLVYHVGAYTGHAPFTEADIDLFLHQYALDASTGRDIKQEFLRQARLDIYPRMVPEQSDGWADRRVFEPLAWMAFLYRRLVRLACQRNPRPLIVGVAERGDSREFSERVLLDRVFRGLREKDKTNYFNTLYGRADLTSPHALLERLGYTDALLLGMLLRPGQFSEPWRIDKYGGLRGGSVSQTVSLPNEPGRVIVNWRPLSPPGSIAFPEVEACFVHVSPTTEPIRVEVFPDIGPEQIVEAARRAYLYARLLPGYGFPVGLEIADRHAHVPTWLTDAYGKLIKHHLSASLQMGEISDSETQRLLVEAIYMTHRDWLFRPRG